ncbi:MAG: twin-arginine translocase subunit TatC [Gammaproteobacteria bacterium]|nr:twin-arginine translocase subunit TatC [Gammaproteobacteria bacterium]MBU2477804.1 twin-arginine translocase subunit TatC [Gammaproteobacteria bacterium]
MAATDPHDDPIGETEQPFLSHLMEVRDRLMRMLAAILVVFLALTPFANKLYTLLADPLMRHMPENSSMIAIEVASPFLIPFKLALVLAIFICVPYLLYQIWGFIAPGLYRHERRLAIPVLVSSTILFYLGGLFAYYVVFPLVFAFLTASAPEGVAVMTDIGKYLDFVLTLFFAFGAAFEVPVVTFVLVWLGVVTPDALVQKRPYVIVGAFVLGMLLTPPDVISQTLLAIPMWMLFELGIFMARHFIPRKENSADAAGHGEYEPPSSEEMDAELDRIEAQEQKDKT